MRSLDHENRIFERTATRGRVADKDGVDEALEALGRVYRKARIHPRDADRVVTNLRTHLESGDIHEQVEKSKHILTVSRSAKRGLFG